MEEVAQRDGEEGEVDESDPGDGVPDGVVHPHDAGDDQAGDPGLEEQVPERGLDTLRGDAGRGGRRVRREDARRRKHDRSQRPAGEVPEEHYRPDPEQPGHAGQSLQHEHDRRERVLRVQLVAAEDDG